MQLLNNGEKKTNKSVVKLLLICGIFAPIVYIGTDFVASQLYPGYSYTNQTISELSAIGAPTQTFWQIMSIVFMTLFTAFGVGVARASKNRPVKISGNLIIFWGITGFVWLFFPMNMRGNIGSVSDTGHLVMSAVTVLLLTSFIWCGSFAAKKGFRVYSVLAITCMLVTGAWVGFQAPQVAANLPTPFIGIIERITVFTPMIWMAVLATTLLRGKSKNR